MYQERETSQAAQVGGGGRRFLWVYHTSLPHRTTGVVTMGFDYVECDDMTMS